jgi:hypothetical protein
MGAMQLLAASIDHDGVDMPMPAGETHEVESHWRRPRGRPAIDANLRRRRVGHDLGDEDKAGFARVVRIGEEFGDMMKIGPASLVVRQHVRQTVRCEDAAGVGRSSAASGGTSRPMNSRPA